MRRSLVSLLAVALLLLPAAMIDGWMGMLRVDGLPYALRSPEAYPVDAREREANHLLHNRLASADSLALWQADADRAMQSPLPTLLPHAERWALTDARDKAVVFEFSLAQPRVLDVRIDADVTASGGLVAELFDADAGVGQAPLASMAPAAREMRWPVSDAGIYRLRVQPLPGSVGSFGVAIDQRHVFEFPVDTDDDNPVKSTFGVARDGGRRTHHGIDIFAPRGTAVLAAAAGVVSRVDTSGRGGLHVWQRAIDDQGRSIGGLYYAHLDTVEVVEGAYVAAGDRIGGVGNTGNARTTPPHLHFGWYERFSGPRDPLPFTGLRRQPRVAATTSGHGWPDWMRVDTRSLNLRGGPGTEHPVTAVLAENDLVRVDAAVGSWLRVRTGNALTGFVAAALLDRPRASRRLVIGDAELRAGPAVEAPVLMQADPEQVVDVLGQFGSWWRVENASGMQAWIVAESPDTRPVPSLE